MSSMTGKQHKRKTTEFRWNEQDLQWLQENAELTAEEQATYLQRTVRSVKQRRKLLGIANTYDRTQVSRTKYLYQRHTEECCGIDPVVIDRIVAAGTIQKFAQQHPVCDCERAYILKYVPEGIRILLTPKPYVQARLKSIDV